MWTNASGYYGMSNYFFSIYEIYPCLNHVFSPRFSFCLKPKHINIKEIQAVLFAFRQGLSVLTNKHILLYENNFAVVQGLKHLFIKDPSMISLHSIAILIALYNITITLI